MSDLEAYEQFWEETMALLYPVLDRLLHSTQLLILEALARLEMPISALVMERISDGQLSKGTYSYHLARLTDLGLLEMVEAKQRRGAQEKFFGLKGIEAGGVNGG